jgi:hypothetical protein
MSEIPPSGTEGSFDNTLSYATTPVKISALALTSMILGIVSSPLVCALGLGIPLGLVALVLGIVARHAINKNPQRLAGKGYAIAGIWTGLFGSLVGTLLIAILIPSTGKSRELAYRSICAANVRGIMQSMSVYAADNNDAFPIVAPNGGYGLAAAGTGTPGPNADATIHSMYLAPPSPSVTQNMWLLALGGMVAPNQFICRSDPALSIPAPVIDKTGNYLTNFTDGTAPNDFAYSYSFAYPWTNTPASPNGNIGGWWKNTTDAGLPLMADMAPLNATGTPAATPGNGRDKNANSFNHQRDGQNVGYGDAHAEFNRLPNVGHNNDNIYAASKGAPSDTGTPPSGNIPNIATGGTPGNWDICLVPAADGNADYKRK